MEVMEEGRAVFPGDILELLPKGSDPEYPEDGKVLKLGCGLEFVTVPNEKMKIDNNSSSSRSLSSSERISDGVGSREAVMATLCGELTFRFPNHYWVQHSTRKRYMPHVGDNIVAIIEDRQGDYYKAEIKSGAFAYLPRLAFDGATKRNRPELHRGQVIYCRVSKAFDDSDTELTCTSKNATLKDWNQGESVYGALQEGLVIPITLQFARDLLKTDNVLLNVLGRHFSFEVSIGLNGVVWVKCSDMLQTLLVRNAILNCDKLKLDDVQTEAMTEALVKQFKKRK